MIKNERYLLVILPSVSLIAGVGLAIAIAKKDQSRILRVFAVTLVGFLFLQMFALDFYKVWSMKVPAKLLLAPKSEKLKFQPNIQTVLFLKTTTPEKSLVLSMRPSDMYYANRKMLSYLDPQLVDFYNTQDSASGAALLKSLGVSYIQIPDYTIPPIYNSSLEKIINDPSITTLVFSNAGSQVYEFTSSTSTTQNFETIPVASLGWNVEYRLALLGRKGLFRIPIENQTVPSLEQVNSFPFEAFSTRVFSKVISSDFVDMAEIAKKGEFQRQEFVVTANLEGEGFVRVVFRCKEFSDLKARSGIGLFIKKMLQAMYILPADDKSKENSFSLYTHSMGEVLLNKDKGVTTFSRRFLNREEYSSCKFSIDHVASNEIKIHDFNLKLIK